MPRSVSPNRWLLIQFGKDKLFWVYPFSSRKTAIAEGRRDAKHGVPYIVVDAAQLLESTNVSDVDLAKLALDTHMKSLCEQLEIPSMGKWEDLSTNSMVAWTEMATAIREKLIGRTEDDDGMS